MQLQPHPLLSSIVKHYLFIESHKGVNLNYRLFSDGNPGLVFHLKDPLLQYSEGNAIPYAQPRSFAYGQITQFNNIVSKGSLRMLVVVLQPYAIYNLLRIPTYNLNNCTVQLADLLGQEALDLEDQILNTINVGPIINLIEQFLLKKQNAINKLDRNIKMALNFIYQHKGIITIENLLKTVPVTERQLERIFKDHIGISPKRFSDTIKFQNFIKHLQKHPKNRSVTEVVLNCGYYDQAHLNNYFKKNTGVTPLQYKANNDLLAINLMPVN